MYLVFLVMLFGVLVMLFSVFMYAVGKISIFNIGNVLIEHNNT